MKIRLPKVKLVHSQCSEYCSDTAPAFRLRCPGCHCSKLINCHYDRSDAMNIAREHFARCKLLFDLRCTIVPQLTAQEWKEGVR